MEIPPSANPEKRMSPNEREKHQRQRRSLKRKGSPLRRPAKKPDASTALPTSVPSPPDPTGFRWPPGFGPRAHQSEAEAEAEPTADDAWSPRDELAHLEALEAEFAIGLDPATAAERQELIDAAENRTDLQQTCEPVDLGWDDPSELDNPEDHEGPEDTRKADDISDDDDDDFTGDYIPGRSHRGIQERPSRPVRNENMRDYFAPDAPSDDAESALPLQSLPLAPTGAQLANPLSARPLSDDSTPQDPRAETATEFHAALDGCLLRLANVILDWDARWAPPVIIPSKQRDWVACKFICPMLAYMPLTVLRAIIDGCLQKTMRENPTVRAWLERQRRRGNQQPALYLQEFTDVRGHSPSPCELDCLLCDVEQYCRTPAEYTANDLEFLHQVDTAIDRQGPRGRGRPPSLREVKNGRLRYLTRSNEARSEERVQDMELFVRQMRARLDVYRGTSGWEQPLPAAWTEVGYAGAPLARLTQHRKHASSVRAMNLVEALSVLRFHGRFRMRQFVLCHIVSAAEASVGERMFSVLAQSYTRPNGTGFNQTAAGIHVFRAWDIEPQDWIRFRARRKGSSTYLNNVADDRKRMEELSTRLALLKRIQQLREQRTKWEGLGERYQRGELDDNAFVAEVHELNRQDQAANTTDETDIADMADMTDRTHITDTVDGIDSFDSDVDAPSPSPPSSDPLPDRSSLIWLLVSLRHQKRVFESRGLVTERE